MRNTKALVGGLAAGALLMYVLDPKHGRDRRATVGRKVNGAARKAASGVGRLDGNWHPVVRSLAGAGASYLALRGFKRGGRVGIPLGALGAGILTRAIVNRPVRRLVGAGDARATMHFSKTIDIDSPVEEVFEFWRHPENFSTFMSPIREVRDLGNGRSHWIANGPAQLPVEWDAEITKLVPQEHLAWRSLEGSSVAHAGTVRFDRNRDGGTRVTVRMSYAPPAGKVGAAVSGLLASIPRRSIDTDLDRLKSLLESSKGSRAAARRLQTPGSEPRRTSPAAHPSA
jgi:uncharacterized membrane protein